MGQVKKVELFINPGLSKQSVQATVKYALSFANDEIGKQFRLKIALFGSDENEKPTLLPNWFEPKPLYVFHFPLFGLIARDYKNIQATQTTMLLQETRTIDVSLLDEDEPTNLGPLLKVCQNELYAEVTLETIQKSDIVEFKHLLPALRILEKEHVPI